MKQLTSVDYIVAQNYECALQCARIQGIQHGWKYLYSVMHIYGTYGAVVLESDCAGLREDYQFLQEQLHTRNTVIIKQPYFQELI